MILCSVSSHKDSPSLFSLWKALQVRQSSYHGMVDYEDCCTSISLSVCSQNMFGKLNQLLKGPTQLSNAKAQRAKSLSQTSLIFSLQFSETQQIIPHLHDHTFKFNLVARSDCITTSLLMNKMYIKYCLVLLNDKGILVTVLCCLICFPFTSQG